MAGIWRLVFTLLAEFTTIACLVLALVDFLGCFQLGPVQNAYMMRIDLSELEVSGIAIFKALDSLNIKTDLYEVYQAGLQGFCYGNYSTDAVNSTTIVWQGCASPETPYWFNLVRILKNSLPSLLFSFISIPDSLNDYTELVKRVNTATWALTLVEFVFAAVLLLTGVLEYFSVVAASINIILSIFMALCGIAASVVATVTWRIYSHAINENFADYGVTATVGSVGLGLAWGAAASGIFTFIFYCISASCYRPAKHTGDTLTEKARGRGESSWSWTPFNKTRRQ